MFPKIMDEFLKEDDHYDDIKDWFMSADTNGDGSLSVTEFSDSLIARGVDLPQSDIVKMFMEFDISGDN